MQELSAELAAAARTIAERIASAGHRAWVVGGAVRDLCLSRAPHEIDLASAATPREIEALFENTIPVGLEFGTVIVQVHGVDVQHTTFRSERGFSDARHPDEVHFGTSLEADASRRDFTCNALYLDPLDDTFVDPVNGVHDLAAGVLACVGEARARFEEDGLRLLRMARFAAGIGLTPRSDVLDAARASGDALRGVSVERVLVELERMLELPDAAVAIGILQRTSLLERCLIGIEPGALAARADLVRELPRAPGVVLGLAALAGPSPEDTCREPRGAWRPGCEAVVERLRPSKIVRRAIGDTWDVFEVLACRASELEARSARIRCMRHAGFERGLALARAWASVAGAPTKSIDALAAEHARARPEELHPAPLLRSSDLAALALPRGPAWGEILAEAERLQLDGQLATRPDALAWLERRAGQDGGKTPRKLRDKG